MEFQRCFLLSLFSILLLHLSLTSAASGIPPPNSQATAKSIALIRKSCNSTQFPDICYSSLSQVAAEIQESQLNIAIIGTGVSRVKFYPVLSYIYNLHVSPITPSLKRCADNFNNGQQKMSGLGPLLLKQKSPVDIIGAESLINTVYGGVNDCLTDLNGLKDSNEKRDLIGLATETQKYTKIAMDLVKLYGSTKRSVKLTF